MQHIQDSIDALKSEVTVVITVVIIAHRLSTVKNTHRVYVVDEGRVIEEGSYTSFGRGRADSFVRWWRCIAPDGSISPFIFEMAKMLISDSHEFIFVHNYKVAGKSIKNALEPYAKSAFERLG
ncbi:hypothetical protein [Salinibacter ruber]|uniref:hypothetical protein n=1 Tax=Salinibacter ruber TaxID=146919 RepID=UPI0020749E2F|nr:hypothetical protein [Salinibacter ruber]